MPLDLAWIGIRDVNLNAEKRLTLPAGFRAAERQVQFRHDKRCHGQQRRVDDWGCTGSSENASCDATHWA